MVEKFRFEPTTHKYFLDNQEIPSVTEIISKVLGNPFEKETVYMIKARDKGTLIHNAINKYLTKKEEPSFEMVEFENFKKITEEKKLSWSLSEHKIWNNIEGMKYAGTIDLYSVSNLEVSDIKTGSTKQLQKWAIQLSMYALALESDNFPVKRASILWLHDTKAEYIPIELYSRDYICDFLRKYYFGDTSVQENNLTLNCLNDKAIKEFKNALAIMEAMKDKIKSFEGQIKAEMEARNISQIKLGDRVISYVASTERETLDTKKLKELHPDIWDECKRVSKVASSIRIK